MTAEEIRERAERLLKQPLASSDSYPIIFALMEIAAQVAELNHAIRQYCIIQIGKR